MHESIKTVGKIGTALITTPPPLLASGNLCLAAQSAGGVGIAITGATALATYGCTVYEQVTGRKLGLPYYVLSGVNAATAASVVGEAGISELLSFQEEAMKAVLPAVAFGSWAVGHAIAGRQEKTGGSPSTPITDKQLWYGIGDLSAVQANSWSYACFGLGLGRALLGIKTKESDATPDMPEGLGKFLKEHAIPSKFYGLGYVLGALASLHHPALAAAQGFWAAGYVSMDREKNEQLISSFKSIIDNSLHAASTSLLEARIRNKEKINVSSGGEILDLGKLMIEVASFTDAAKITLGIGTGNFLEKATDTLSALYATVDQENKADAFALLEVLAGKCRKARTTILDLNQQGDILARAKIQRMTERLLGYERPDLMMQTMDEMAERAIAMGCITREESEKITYACNLSLHSTDLKHPNPNEIRKAKGIIDSF